MFGTDYLELIGIPSGSAARQEIMADPFGLNGLVFGTEDAASVAAALSAAGVPHTPPNQFSRPVDLPGGGARDAVFRTVHVQPPAGRPGRLYFCHHFTRDLVWRDEWRRHANGALGVVRVLIASDDPAILHGLFSAMFGAEALRTVADGCSLLVGLARVDVLAHAAVASLLGPAAPDAAGRSHYMAALTLRARALGQATDALTAGGLTPIQQSGRLLVPASAAMNCALEFVE